MGNSGWENRPLFSITEIVGGGTPRTNNSAYWSGDIVWLSPTDLPPIGEIVHVSDSKNKITRLGLEKSSARLLPKGSIVFSSRASIGKIGITDVELCTNQGFANFICDASLYNKFLAYALKKFTPEITALSNSTTFAEVSKSSLKGFSIPVPPLPEQHRIVTKLDSLFERIDKATKLAQQNIVRTQQFMASVLNDVFAECYSKYPSAKIADIAKTKSGGTPNRSIKQYWNGDIVWLKSGELNDCMNITENTEFITAAGLNNSSATVFPKGTLLLAMYGATAGKLGILGMDASTNQAICSIQNDKKLFDPVFLFFYLYSIRRQILTDSTGGAQPNISKTYIDAIDVPLPPLAVQIAYVKTFLMLDTQNKQMILKQSERLALLFSLKSSLLDAAFRGEL